MKPQAKQPEHVERAQFAKRVQAALVARGMPVSATELQRAFNARNPELAISVHAARKWLMGESIPTQASLRELAAVLGERGFHQGGMSGLPGERDLLSVPAQA